MVQWISFFLLIVLVGLLAWMGVRIIRNRRQVPEEPPEPGFRFFVLVRKSQPGTIRFLQMTTQDRTLLHEILGRQWQELQKEISRRARYVDAMAISHSELSDSGSGWSLFGYYKVENRDLYLQCLDLVKDPRFTDLRNYCDIQFAFGAHNETFYKQLGKLF